MLSNFSKDEESKAIQPEFKKGDVLIFDSRLIHSSNKINSINARFAYRVAYSGITEGNYSIIPIGAPLVLSGGDPNYYSQSNDIPTKSIFKRAIRKIGKKLLTI